MFDLRYHVASLAAVFLALTIGIMVGVGISGSGLVEESERRTLNRQIERLQSDLDAERNRSREQEAAGAFLGQGYDAVMRGRLSGKAVAIVSVGSLAPELQSAIERTLRDADGTIARVRALAVPIRRDTLLAAVSAAPDAPRYAGDPALLDLGRDLGRELVAGGETPLWDAVAEDLVRQRQGGNTRTVDAVVIARSRPQRGDTARFLTGLYEGLQGRVPAVGVETRTASPSAIGVFRRARFSSVDAIETAAGRVALAVLLSGAESGHYGLRADADAILPPIAPVPSLEEGA